MDLSLFAFNILLTTMYTTIIIVSIAAYLMNKHKVFLLISIIFACYLFDNTLNFTIELFPMLNATYTSMYLNSPISKILQYSAICYCFLAISRELTFTKIGFQETIIYIVLVVCMLCSPVLLPEPLASTIFYSVVQCFNIYIAFYIYGFAKKNLISFFSSDNKWLARVMLALILLHLFIILEDVYIINMVDQYDVSASSIIYRSLSENIMTFSIATFILVFILRLFYHYSLFPSTQQQLPIEQQQKQAFATHFDLTHREEEIFSLVIEYNTSQEIALLLNISDSTVKTHIHNIYSKCKVQKKRDLLHLYQSFES